MSSFRKKPVVIEAFRWTGGPDQKEDLVWACNAVRDKIITFEPYGDGRVGNRIVIHTLEGPMRGEIGDWIIRGVKGEIYPCKPDIFAATYEPA